MGTRRPRWDARTDIRRDRAAGGEGDGCDGYEPLGPSSNNGIVTPLSGAKALISGFGALITLFEDTGRRRTDTHIANAA